MAAEDPRRLALVAAVGAAMALVLALAPFEVSASFAVVAVLSLPMAFVLVRRDEGETRALLVLFVSAVALRCAVSLVAAYGFPRGFFALDDHRYVQLGLQIASHWAGDAPWPQDLYGPIGYYRWNALLFTLLGDVPLAPAMANAALGGYAVVLVFRIAEELAGARAARAAGVLVALWPSIVLWSSLGLKDAPVIVALLLILRGAQRQGAVPHVGGLVQLGAGFLILSQLRDYMVWIAAGSVALGWIGARVRHAPLLAVPALLAAVVFVPSLGPLEDLALDDRLLSLEQSRSQLAFGNSAYLVQSDVSSPVQALLHLPLGLVYFLLAPAPWQLLNARQVLTLPEMLVWYSVLPLVVSGALYALRERFAATLPLVGFSVLTTVSYALVEGNLGTAYRHRAQVLVLFLLFAGIGWARRERHRPTEAGPARVAIAGARA